MFDNLGLVYRHVAWKQDISEKDRSKQLWGLETLASGHRRHANEPPLDVLVRLPTDMPSLRPLLKRPPRTKLDCSDATWRNVRAAVFAAMRACELPVRARRRRRALSWAWTGLMAGLSRYERLAVEPFAEWCDEHSIEPDTVEQSKFEAYAKWLLEVDTGDRPEMTYANLCHLWNRLAQTRPEWPKVQVRRPPGYDSYGLEWEAFSPSFRADVDAMTAAALDPDPFAERKPRRIRPGTAIRQADELRRLASALVHQTGRDPKSITGIADLVEPGAARAALTFLLNRSRSRQT